MSDIETEKIKVKMGKWLRWMARIVWRAGKKGQIKEVVKSDNRVEERAEKKRVEGKRGVFGKEGELIKRTRIRQKEE